MITFCTQAVSNIVWALAHLKLAHQKRGSDFIVAPSFQRQWLRVSLACIPYCNAAVSSVSLGMSMLFISGHISHQIRPY